MIGPLTSITSNHVYPAGQAGRYGGYHFSINGLPLKGSFDIKEAFVELNVPLARDVPFFNALDVNGAVRYADYSTAGGAIDLEDRQRLGTNSRAAAGRHASGEAGRL